MIKSRKPLKNRSVILLRALDQSLELSEELQRLGANVIQCPMIEIVPNQKVIKQLDANFLNPFNLVIFTSSNGVRIFMNGLYDKGLDARKLANKKIFVIGPKTKETCKEYGLIADAMPK